MGAGRRWSATLAVAPVLALGAAAGPPPPPQPWPDRPVVALRFDVADDLGSVDGRQRVRFVPDLPTCELVFRAWPNKPATAEAGSSLALGAVRVDGRRVDPVVRPAGAPEEAPMGTLVEVPLQDCLDPGEAVVAELDFRVELGLEVDERVGTSPAADVAWFATAFPLLAWERDRGWDRGPAVDVAGEMAVSEDFRLDRLEVVAPEGYGVLGTGRPRGTTTGDDGRTVHRFEARAVRDVSVAVGRFPVVERDAGGVRLHLGMDARAEAATPEEWLDEVAQGIRDLELLLGPFPYPDLWISVLSAESSGIEFPGAIQFGDVDPAQRRGLVVHELAHMWFYGLVGNHQGRDPWLDESFATFAQMVVTGDAAPYPHEGTDQAPPVGAPMTTWAEYRRPSTVYYDTVYTFGGAALVEARHRAGAAAFDAALARYLHDNAYAVAAPDDVRRAFAHLPEVLAVLREVAALP